MELPPCDARAEFLTDDDGLDNGAQMLLVIVPLRLHVLDLVGVRQDDLVKFRCVEDGEVEGDSSGRDILYEIHSGLEFIGKRRHDDVLKHLAGGVAEHSPGESCSGDAWETHPLVLRHIDLTHRIGAVGGVGCRKGILADNLAPGNHAAFRLDVIKGQNVRLRRGRTMVPVVGAVT